MLLVGSRKAPPRRVGVALAPGPKTGAGWNYRITKIQNEPGVVALVPVLSLGLLGGSVAMAAPAQAETSRNGCTVDPLAPRDFRGNRVDFKIKVHCYGEKTVQIRQLRYEDEPGPRRSDDFVGSSYFTQKFERRDDARTIHSFDHVATLTAGAHALAPVCAGCRVLGGLLGSGSGKTVDGATI